MILPGLPGGTPYIHKPVPLSGRLLVPAHVAKQLAPDSPLGDYARAWTARKWGLPTRRSGR